MNVPPTRMELLKTKERIKLAKKGHKLLKQKRDALILEFFKLLKKAKDLRATLNKKIKEAYRQLVFARLYHSEFEVERLASLTKRPIWADAEVRNVMGVKIPEISIHMEDFKRYPPHLSSAKLDATVSAFSEVLELSIELAQTETALKRLIGEIEKTKRRVNALEYIILPSLEQQKKEISLRLDEMERDGFVSLKTIKRKVAQD